MKATEFITEIERIPQSAFQGGKDFIKQHLTQNPGKKNIKPLPGGSGLYYATLPRPHDGIEIRILDKSQKNSIGSLRLNKIGKNILPIENPYMVNVITVDEDYRGQGIGKALYGIALSILKVTLVAGESQTPAGRKNWLSLVNIPGVEVKGYVELMDRELSTYNFPKNAKPDQDNSLHVLMRMLDIERINKRNKTTNNNIDTLMGKLGGQYLGTNKHDEHYFAFDVVPGTGELEPAVKTNLSKIYHGAYNMQYVSGLFAKWAGQ